jgi:hypothetical protein
MPPATNSAISAPVEPPIRKPTPMNSAVKPASNRAVRT